VPTTAGTGSEVTRFATFYHDGRKVSLDADEVRPDVAIVDPALTDGCPPWLTWCCALDALAHAVESFWSTRATPRSREFAARALEALVPVLAAGGTIPATAGRDALSRAATLAGRAIDITRTTAAHAFAYPLTARLGVPHGHACALHLIWLAPLVEHCADTEIVHPLVPALRNLLNAGDEGLGPAIRDLVTRTGLPTDLTTRSPATTALTDLIMREGFASNRMAGMPIPIPRETARIAISRLLRPAPTGLSSDP
jgi:alcohol dehydrogenase